MRAAALLTSLLLGAAAHADAPAGVLTRAPEVIAPAVPEYPPDARAAGLSGEVVLEIDVGEDGEVLDARIAAPAGHGFDDAALAAARALRFSPAEIDGEPAAVTIEYRFRFEAPAAEAPPSPRAVLRGVVLERGTRAPLPGIEVVIEGGAAVFTDREGRFELEGLAPGAVKVTAGGTGHHPFVTEETLADGQAVEVRYHLRPVARDGYEAVVVGERQRKEVATVTLSAGEVSRIAGVSGDTVRVVQNLPGVARQPGGFGALVVRGGNPNDTRVYLDGVEVPLVFHFGGLTSIVPSELVEAVDFEPGNFGVRHGRATGGRVDLATRDPDGRKLHLVTDANLFHALALVEGPASEDVAVAVALRRSYADAVVSRAARSSDDFGVAVAPRYYDFQGKLVWRPGADDVVRLSIFGSDDRMELTGVETGGLEDLDRLRIGTAFAQASASWDHRVSETARIRLALAQSVVDVANRFGELASERDRFHLTTVRAEGSRDLGGRLRLAAGLDARFLPRASLELEYPEIPPPNQLPDPDPRTVRFDRRLSGIEAGLWAEATWRPVEGVTIVPGVRIDHVDWLAPLTWVDPRLSARWAVREGTTVKGGAGLYHQPPLPGYLTREWGNPALREEGAWHFMTGVEQRIGGPVSADLQLYYKRLFDLAIPSARVVERDGASVPERFASAGTGEAYGAELLLRWNPGGRFFGWIAYSLSRSVRHQDVIGGTIMPTGEVYDQPHNVVALGTVELPEVWDGLSAGFRFRYATGNPYRRVVGAVYDADADVHQPVHDTALAARMPDFFQLDLRVDKRWTWNAWTLSAYLEAQNATNRQNPEEVAYRHDYTERGWTTGLPFFPSFGLRAEY